MKPGAVPSVNHYRKKPVVITAMRFASVSFDHMQKLVEWMGQGYGYHDGMNVYIHTSEGTMRASLGDYIICGVKGEFYPCKPDIFEATYEAA